MKRRDSETGRLMTFHFMPDIWSQRTACGLREVEVAQFHRRGVSCARCRKSQWFKKARARTQTTETEKEHDNDAR
jgi:hypothetical protein